MKSDCRGSYLCVWLVLMLWSILGVNASLSESSITMGDDTVNSQTQHTWAFKYTTIASTTKFKFIYPPCIDLGST